MIQLASHFQSDDSRRHSEWLRQQQWFIKARHEQERREKLEEKMDDDLAAFASEVVMANEARIAEFRIKLDSYDEATVAAILENQEALDAVNARIEAYLARAYVMEDGRRVFKTEDGTQVFDEFGEQVTPDELDFDLIGDDKPKWEEYQPDFEVQQRLLAEQQALIEYQEKLDEAREATADGEISDADLEDLDAELLELMPDSVRDHAGIAPATPAPDLSASFAIPARDGILQDTQNPAPTSGTGRGVDFTPMG